ncbi:MAG TPA: flagellar biosynthetic protein FliO [Polyangiaceae bacterium]|nr:flagellar biosynthetic protein FliO [Polyangiaceae bacterium]
MTLLLVSGLAILVLFAARRTGVGKPLGPMKLAGRLVLDARRAIYLVRVGETYLVVGASEAGLTKLGELTSEAVGDLPVMDELSAPRTFQAWLQRLGAQPPPARAPDKGVVEPGAPRE